MRPRPFSKFVHLERDSASTPLKLDRDFWINLRKDPPKGRLAGGVRLRRNTGWEMHPDGDEFLILLSGRIDLVLDEGEQERTVNLRAGKAYIVPRGVWHRQLVREPSELLFFTPGPRTEHRPVRRGKR